MWGHYSHYSPLFAVQVFQTPENTSMNNRPFASHGNLTKYSFVLDIPVGGLLSSMAVFVPCDRKLQRAYYRRLKFKPHEWLQIYTCIRHFYITVSWSSSLTRVGTPPSPSSLMSPSFIFPVAWSRRQKNHDRKKHMVVMSLQVAKTLTTTSASPSWSYSRQWPLRPHLQFYNMYFLKII